MSVFRNDEKTVIGSDKRVQALLVMWDENLLTVDVDAPIADKVKEGDIVLIDYAPRFPTIPVPKQLVIKILRGEVAKKIWAEYTEKHKKRKKESAEQERVPDSNFHIR